MSLAEHEIDEQDGACGSPIAGDEWRNRLVCRDFAPERHFSSKPAGETGRDPAPFARPHL